MEELKRTDNKLFFVFAVSFIHSLISMCPQNTGLPRPSFWIPTDRVQSRSLDHSPSMVPSISPERVLCGKLENGLIQNALTHS